MSGEHDEGPSAGSGDAHGAAAPSGRRPLSPEAAFELLDGLADQLADSDIEYGLWVCLKGQSPKFCSNVGNVELVDVVTGLLQTLQADLNWERCPNLLQVDLLTYEGAEQFQVRFASAPVDVHVQIAAHVLNALEMRHGRSAVKAALSQARNAHGKLKGLH